MTQDITKHLDYIQAIIIRMGSNSFQVKGWGITISSALLAIYASTKNEMFIFLAIAPTFICWLLDSYYLMQERKFRGLYNDVSGVSGISTKIKPYSMEIEQYTGGKYNFKSALFSITTSPLYLTICIILSISYAILKR